MSHQRPIFKGLQMNFLYSTLKVKKRKIRKFDLKTDGKNKKILSKSASFAVWTANPKDGFITWPIGLILT